MRFQPPGLREVPSAVARPAPAAAGPVGEQAEFAAAECAEPAGRMHLDLEAKIAGVERNRSRADMTIRKLPADRQSLALPQKEPPLLLTGECLCLMHRTEADRRRYPLKMPTRRGGDKGRPQVLPFIPLPCRHFSPEPSQRFSVHARNET